MKRRKRSDARVLFLFLGVALTLVLAGIVLQNGVGTRKAVEETPPASAIDPASALPADAAQPAETSLTPSIDPTYAYAYVRNGGVEAALVKWDRQQGRYVLVATLKASELGLTNGIQPRIAVEDPKWGGLQVFAVTAPQGASTDATVLVAREGDTLRVLHILDKDGAVRPASFLSGASVQHVDAYRLEDLDGDGVQEVVATSGALSPTDGTTVQNADTRVFRWNGSLLAYDTRMSWAYSLSDSVFPQPAAPPDAAAGGSQ